MRSLPGRLGKTKPEDDFDAMMSAAGLLRCVLESHPLDGSAAGDDVEGAILGLGCVDLAARTVAERARVGANPRTAGSRARGAHARATRAAPGR